MKQSVCLAVPFGLSLVGLLAVATSHEYMAKDCIAYLEVDARLRQLLIAQKGEFADDLNKVRDFLFNGWMKIYKGPTSKHRLVMEKLLMEDRNYCPRLPRQ